MISIAETVTVGPEDENAISKFLKLRSVKARQSVKTLFDIFKIIISIIIKTAHRILINQFNYVKNIEIVIEVFVRDSASNINLIQ